MTGQTMTDVQDHYVTFGVQYRHEEHPLGMHPDGYAVIEAPDEETARKIAIAIFGTAWAFMYDREHFIDDGTRDKWHTEKGEMLRIKWVQRHE